MDGSIQHPNELESRGQEQANRAVVQNENQVIEGAHQNKIRYSPLHNTESLQVKDQAEDQTDRTTARALKKLYFILNRDLKPPREYTWKETKEQGGGEKE